MGAIAALLTAAAMASAQTPAPRPALQAYVARPGVKPRRIMSMNLCSDELLMMMAEPERIASVTYVARRGTATPAMDALARRLAINHGLAEEVLSQKPDLVVSGDFTTPVTRRLIKAVGVPLVELKSADSFDDIRNNLRILGAALNERARAEAWIARLDSTLDKLDRTVPKRRISAIGWNGVGRVSTKRSLFNAILTAAGGDNVAAHVGRIERSFDLEQLLSLRPQPNILLFEDSSRPRVGISANQVEHPILARAFGQRRLAYPSALYACGTPYSADAAVELRQAMLGAMAATGDRR